jgi:hypothetical protein
MARLLRFVLVGAFIAVVVVTTATADSPVCTHGVSSVGPVTLTQGRLSGNATPHTEPACRSERAPVRAFGVESS